MGKGDKKRPTNKEHSLCSDETDLGSVGCKKMELHVYRGTTKCIYCKKSKQEVDHGTT